MKLNLLILAMAMSGLFTLQSCEKEVPEVDTEQPSLSVTIRGPGITRTVTDLDADRYQFNLAYGVEYDLIISIGDTGGCKELHAQVFQDMNPTEFTSLISGREVTRRNLGISTYFDLVNTGAPLSGLSMTGSIILPQIPQGQGISYSVYVYGSDYGGQGGRPNQNSLSLNIFSEGGVNPGVIELY